MWEEPIKCEWTNFHAQDCNILLIQNKKFRKKEDKENAGDSKVASQKGVADFLSRQQKAKNMQ